jgi:hypothetical protein
MIGIFWCKHDQAFRFYETGCIRGVPEVTLGRCPSTNGIDEIPMGDPGSPATTVLRLRCGKVSKNLFRKKTGDLFSLNVRR